MLIVIKKVAIYTMFITLTVIAMLIGFYIGFNYKHYVYEPLNEYVIGVSTTTSLYQTGVLNDLLNDFINTSRLNIKFKLLVRGSGEALRLLADGVVCIAFVHAPSIELKYLEQGKIEKLAMFAYNEFVVVGPQNDPANVGNASNIIEVFKRIYFTSEKGLTKFVSRGDMSGTHVKELQIWSLSGYNPEGRSWYLRSGQGMTQTILIAENLNAYTLSDLGTYLILRNQGKIKSLTILFRDPLHLINVYSVYLSKSYVCDNPYTWYVAYKLRDYLLTQGQELLRSRYAGLLNPVKDVEETIASAWRELSKVNTS